MSSLVPRVWYELRRYGVRATIGKAAQYARKMVYTDQTHVWYELPLGTDRPRVPLPPGLTLIRGDASDVPLHTELSSMSEWAVRQLMETGNDLWLVLDEQRPTFACWIFRGSMPVRAARTGRLTLLPEIVCLENSVTSAYYRGRGIAPAAWAQIADSLEQTTVKSIITKIEENNAASRRAVMKSGFSEIATVHFRRVGLQQYTTVQAETGATAEWLAGQLLH